MGTRLSTTKSRHIFCEKGVAFYSAKGAQKSLLRILSELKFTFSVAKSGAVEKENVAFICVAPAIEKK